VGSKVLVLALQDVPRNDVGRYEDAQRRQQKRPGLITVGNMGFPGLYAAQGRKGKW
jgi:hypothetical protein